jgi:hypothetical protein
VERHVDLWTERGSCAQCPGCSEAPVPGRDGGLGGAGGRGAAGGQRQRIDSTRPATMAPNPIAKFHTPSVVMKAILSPAT